MFTCAILNIYVYVYIFIIPEGQKHLTQYYNNRTIAQNPNYNKTPK